MTAQKEKICREGVSLRENLSDTEQNIGRNVDAKVYSDGVSDKNNKHVIGQCRKVNPCYKVAKNLELCLCLSVLWKIKSVSNKIGCLLEKTSKPSCKRNN